MRQLVVEEPLKPLVRGYNAESKAIGFNAQDDLVIRHGYGPAMSGIFKVCQNYIGGSVPVRPETLVKIQSIQVGLPYVRDYIRIPVPEIDHVQVVLLNTVNELRTQNPGQARDHDCNK